MSQTPESALFDTITQVHFSDLVGDLEKTQCQKPRPPGGKYRHKAQIASKKFVYDIGPKTPSSFAK